VPRLLLALAASAVAARLSLTGFAGTVELQTYPDVRRLRARAALPRSVTIARGCSTIQRGISRALWGAVAVSPGYTALRR